MSDKIKRLYSFSFSKETELDKPEESTNEKGEKVVVTKKVKEKLDHTFFLRKPTRALRDEAELFYGSKHGEALKAGLLPQALLAKRFENDDGTLSKPQLEALTKLYNTLSENQVELTKLSLIPEKEKTENDKSKIKELTDSNLELLKKIQDFRAQQANLYDNTAEVYARNKTVFFWTLMLAYKVEKDKEIPYFGDGLYEDKIKVYDDFEEQNEDFSIKVIKKFLFATSLWFSSGIVSQEDFDKYLSAAEAELV